MPAVNLGSIMKKIEAYGRSVNGKLRMKERIQKYAADGKGKTEAGGRVITEGDMWTAASKMISVLRSTAQSHALPASVLKHFDSLECSSIYTRPDGSSFILIYFGDDLHRDSLYSDGYDGINNIVALLNNGYHAKGYAYGWWEGHKPTGESIYISGAGSADAYIRSRKDREGLHYIQQAVTDFNSNYGYDFNVTAVAGDDYK